MSNLLVMCNKLSLYTSTIDNIECQIDSVSGCEVCFILFHRYSVDMAMPRPSVTIINIMIIIIMPLFNEGIAYIQCTYSEDIHAHVCDAT